METAIRDLPTPKQEQIRQSIQEIFMGFVERSTGPRIDPETAKILVASVDKENEHKFQFLTQKQGDSARQTEREHILLEVQKHNDRITLAKPLLYVSLALIVGCTTSGVYLAAIGHETLGSSILVGIFASVLGYLGGLGTANFFKSKKE